MTNSGLILLNKKPGLTSFDALRDIKRALGTGKVGHTGTLDKFASGLLVVLAGSALKLSQWFSGCDKEYLGTIKFGAETDTLDPEGKIIAEAPLPSREKVEQALSLFTGNIMQSPPAYSAIHINGQRASALARQGVAPEMKKRPVTVYDLELRSWQPPFAEIFVRCSSGTYIRSLARDIACAAESRAHLSNLVRTRVADFRLENSVNSVKLTSLSNVPETAGFLKPIDKTIIGALGLPWFEVTPEDAQKIIQGKPLAPILENKPAFPSQINSQTAAVFEGEKLTAVVEKINGKWKYSCVFAD
ncbi:MAG TPA: tRNA pseudouridine(55) synthase TruB [Clostridiales bacterium]|nr:tRNA pseudouridine(55) synthase TruB [Clostridiales bacterium]